MNGRIGGITTRWYNDHLKTGRGVCYKTIELYDKNCKKLPALPDAEDARKAVRKVCWDDWAAKPWPGGPKADSTNADQFKDCDKRFYESPLRPKKAEKPPKKKDPTDEGEVDDDKLDTDVSTIE